MSEYVWQRGVESRDGHAVVWCAHIRMKLHRKICIVYAYIHICRKTEYMRRNCICAEKLHMLIWKVNSSVPPDRINDFEKVNCTNCECSFMLSDDLIPHNLLVYALTYAVRKRHAHNAHFRIYQYADHAQICRKPQPHRRIYAWNRIIRNRMANSSRESLRNGWWYQKK